MDKKIIITEEQLNHIINEALGIAKNVANASKELKKQLFNEIELNGNGTFDFLDLKVKYKTFSFNNNEDFYNWYDDNYKEIVNGYSFEENTLYLTLIVINGDYNISALNDTIQHELEHYYQCKMAGHGFWTASYNNACH